jgi:hypothetical protein
MLSCCLVIAGAASAQDFVADIDGSQEVPSTNSPGAGQGCFSFDPATSMLSYDISFGGLIGVETAAHFHGPALPGQNAGVQFPLPLGSPKIGSVGPLNALQVGFLTGGLMYVNIHTNVFPGGEIRGQVLTGTCPPVQVEPTSWGAIKSLYRE